MTPTDLAVALLALLGVVALILLARRAALRLPMLTGTSPGPGPLRLEQTMALDARRRLRLIACGDRKLLLLTGGGQDVLVSWPDLPPVPPVAPP
jgi:flagellar protein FliO/FliZ